MRNQRLVCALMCAMLAVATSTRAQDNSTQATSHSFPEITPYVFFGSNGSSGVGAGVRWPLPAHLSVELEANYRWAEVNALNSNVSLLYDFPEVARVTPYVAAGVGFERYGFAEGFERYGVADQSPAGDIVTHTATALTVNAGGGVRVRADENWGIRSDARWQNGVGDKSPERWRLYNGVTFAPKGR